MSIRPAEPKDAANYTEWLKAASDINMVDLAVYKYPTCNTVTVEKDGEPVLMNSVHLVLVMEALAPKPGISPLTEARALKELFDGIKNLAAASGVKEIVFGCKDERLIKFIEGRDFERLNYPVFRFKI